MNRYVVSPRARQDLQSIWDYIALTNHNPRAADRLIDRLTKAFVALAGQPLMGEARHDLRPSLRMFSVGNYVILYYPAVDGVEIAGVLHGARDIEAIFRREGR